MSYAIFFDFYTPRDVDILDSFSFNFVCFIYKIR
nr:MAG TPA: hypothetical protein [Caudoviricetes sp.]